MAGAGDQKSPWARGGAAFPPAMPQPLPRCHPPNPLHSSLPIPCDGPLPVPPWTTSPFFDVPLQQGHELSIEQLNDLSEIAGGGAGLQAIDWETFYPLELGAIVSSSASAPFNSQTVSSSFRTAALPPEAALGGGIVTSDPAAVLMDNPLASSTTGGPVDFYSMGQQELPCYSSAVPFSGCPAVSSNRPAALPPATTTFCPPPGQELPYYSTGEPLINNPSAISGAGPTVPPRAVGHPQAEPSEKNGIDFSLIWTPEEQRQLVELCKRYGHIEDPVIRVAKIARPFPGKTMRDVALRMRWMEVSMEEKKSQRTKAVNSSKSRGTKVSVRSRDHLSHSSSQPGVPY